MSAWVTIARLVKTQGRKGELAAELLTDIPDRFSGLRQVWLRQGDGRELLVHVARHWPHQGRVVLGFDEIGDMDAAAAWVGAEVQVPLAERAMAPAGEYFLSDLQGCTVSDQGRAIGMVASIESVGGAAALLHVQGSDGKEILIPFAASYVIAIDVAARRLDLHLPEGLVDLNG